MPLSFENATKSRSMGRLGGVAALLLMMNFASALAQEATPKSKTDDKLPEVIVTANRQGAENIQNVPMAITAINPESLEDVGLSSLTDLTRLAPSLSLQQGGPGLNRIDIRGITTSGYDTTNVQDRSLVAVYYDDTPISLQSSNPDLKVFDLERAEVLRGPQGTLYGAGAMAGTIRLITKKPDLENYQEEAESTVSDTTEGSGGINYSLRGMVNIPIIEDELALRIVAYHGDDDGFIENIGQHQNGANDYVTNQTRAALRFKPNDQLTIDASMTYEQSVAGGLNNAFTGLGPYQFTSLEPEGTSDNLKLWNVTAAYDLGWATATSSTSFLDRHFHDDYADEYGPNIFFGLRGIFPPTPGSNFTWDGLQDVIQETRLVSGDMGIPLKWTAGVFYEHTHRDNLQDQPYQNWDNEITFLSHYFGLPSSFQYNSLSDGAFHPNDDFSGYQHITEHQIAVYGEATYTLWDRLDVTAGLRYFDWEQHFGLYFGGAFGCSPCAYETGTVGSPLREQGDASAHGVNPRFATAFHIDDDSMIYAEAARGFRYGGVNQPVPVSICEPYLKANGLTQAPVSFGPDSLWNYEVGEKSTLFDHRLTLNVTGFVIDWNDVQLEQFLKCAYYYVVNKGKIQSRGAEVEASAKITPALTVSANFSYTDSVADGTLTAIGALNGQRAPYFPRFISSVTAEYVVPVDENTLSFDVNFSAKSNAFSAFNPQTTGYSELPSNTQLNLAINYEMANWELGLFGDNVTDGYKVQAYNSANYILGLETPGREEVLARPRTFGVRAKASFSQPLRAAPAYVAPIVPTPAVTPPPVAAKPEPQRQFQVFFDFDKSEITEAAAKVIKAAADVVKSGNIARITVTGHTDTVGSAAYNQALSERRAAAVSEKLIADGVKGDEITRIGVGKNGLLVPTKDGVREAQNRRAEIVLN